jgi:hypothetical protein
MNKCFENLRFIPRIVLNLTLTHRAMGVPFFVEEITGSGKLTTKDYTPTQVNMLPEIYLRGPLRELYLDPDFY